MAVDAVSSELVSVLFPVTGKNTGKSSRFSQPNPGQSHYPAHNSTFFAFQPKSGQTLTGNYQGNHTNY
jgi:hypothetical protein